MKLKVLLIILSLGFSLLAFSQWTGTSLEFTSPGTTYTKFQFAEHTWSGSHAILFNAYKQISVSGGLGTTGNTKYANDFGAYGGGAGAIMFSGNGGIMDFFVSPGSTGAHTNITWGIPKMRIQRDGYVGIGTAAPQQIMHLTAPNSTIQLRVERKGSGIEGVTDLGTDGNGFHIWAGGYDGFHNTDMFIGSSGEVGIGTTNPTNKLEVNGTIRSKEVKVEASPWPDYVFEKDYELRSLEETEAYIKENKHLPEIPSAKEMEANGVALGEMNRLLLQKIEELTLHLIDKEKEIEHLKGTVNDLSEKITRIDEALDLEKE